MIAEVVIEAIRKIEAERASTLPPCSTIPSPPHDECQSCGFVQTFAGNTHCEDCEVPLR